ncbi:hypothetical protein SHIRM173S_08516 [Streptomyces hirsutus]
MAPAPASDASSAHYASYGTPEAQYGDFTMYGGYDANGFALTVPETGGHATTAFSADPLFADLPGNGHDQGAYATGNTTGTWSTAGRDTAHYDAYAATEQQVGYDTGGYDATTWTTGQQQAPEVPHQAAASDASGQWDSGTWLRPDQAQNAADPAQQWYWGTQTFDTGAYDAAQWNSDGSAVAPLDAYADPYEHQAVPLTSRPRPHFRAASRPRPRSHRLPTPPPSIPRPPRRNPVTPTVTPTDRRPTGRKLTDRSRTSRAPTRTSTTIRTGPLRTPRATPVNCPR